MGVRAASAVYRFGPFELDAAERSLSRDSEPVWLSNRQMDILLVLVAHAGRVVSKDALAKAVWGSVNVSNDSIDKGLSLLRDALGPRPDAEPYIATHRGRGVRLTTLAHCVTARPRLVSLDDLLGPYQAFVDGRAALETLDREAIARARPAFEHALSVHPQHPAAHIGLANACLLAFEMTRADLHPDDDALAQAAHHAPQACELDPLSADAWSTLAVVWHRTKTAAEAIKAARRAVDLEPGEWRHHLRLAFVSWGDMRLRAALRVLTLCPGVALAHWLAATVFVARGAFVPAMEHIRLGCALQDAQSGQEPGGNRFRAVGLHLMDGMVLGAQGDSAAIRTAAHEALMRELAMENTGHIYWRESQANTWYTLGARALRQNHGDAARSSFQEALNLVRGHPLATVGLAFASGHGTDSVRAEGKGQAAKGRAQPAIDVATVHAGVLALQGHHEDAARVYHDAFIADPSASGWLLPVEPLLHVAAHRDEWAKPLAAVRDRAS